MSQEFPLSRLLVVDDEPVIREVIEASLAGRCHVRTTDSAAEALSAIAEDDFALLLCDLWMPRMSGVDVVRAALAARPDMAVIIMTGSADLDAFAQLLGLGVVDYLLKPFTPNQLRAAVDRGLRLRQLAEENRRLCQQVPVVALSPGFIALSPAMLEVSDLISRVAPTEATVLVTGETGTGKEMVARAIHEASPRRAGPFVAVNCGGLSDSLLESELFGHARGAFTGADVARRGCFEAAAGGTLVLDEVAEMPLPMQVRLLRVLAEREITRVGETTARPVDVRVVALTSADLRERVEDGSFREDLYFRLAVVPVALPPLRERGEEDIRALAEVLLEQACVRLGARPRALGSGVVETLLAHAWPGNVRELANVLERAVLRSGDAAVIATQDIVVRPVIETIPSIELPDEGLDMRGFLRDIEDRLIAIALARTGGSRQLAADLLGLKRTALVERLRRHPHRAVSQRQSPVS